VEYIARNLAPELWMFLSNIVEKSLWSLPKIKVKKNQLWYLIDQINQSRSNNYFIPINLSSPPGEGTIFLERYEIEEHLFDRDSGERHFRAIDRYMGDKPCLVIQRCHQTAKIEQRFYQEAKVLSQLGKHPQIPQLLAYFTEEQYLYLIYEEILGEPLTNKLLTGQPWEETEVKSLLHNLLTVLEFIQQQNVIHRNLNPDNIIRSDNQLVLIDFATVKEINQPGNSISQSTFAQGMAGYIPAEQHMGITTFASDIYAIGKIAVHALTGIHPRKLKINPQTANTVWRNQAQVSDRFADIIDRAICHHFPQRYQSATEMLESLKH
jgi:eukaryotic-like serine/threonine-protein kinase